MVLPQIVIISWIGYFSTYSKLLAAAELSDRSVMSSLEMRSEVVPLTSPVLDQSAPSENFNVFDTYTEEVRTEECQLVLFDLQPAAEHRFKYEEIMRGITNTDDTEAAKLSIRCYPGDIYHPNENYPWEVKKNYRHRVYYHGYRVIRYEISKPVFERYLRGVYFSKM